MTVESNYAIAMATLSALSKLQVIASNSHWSIALFASVSCN